MKKISSAILSLGFLMAILFMVPEAQAGCHPCKYFWFQGNLCDNTQNNSEECVEGGSTGCRTIQDEQCEEKHGGEGSINEEHQSNLHFDPVSGGWTFAPVQVADLASAQDRKGETRDPVTCAPRLPYEIY